jgi:NAD(P)-dependent dehydrogenase (short-subunit alcohol dehydrogenase family)
VRKFAADLLERYPRIDVVANNAGGILGAHTVSEDGNEQTFQVNHLAPFLLTNLLIERLTASKATVLNTSSIANARFARFDIDDLNAEKEYSENRDYDNAKLANILFTSELHSRFFSAGDIPAVVDDVVQQVPAQRLNGEVRAVAPAGGAG